jgi:hypothetical protein
VIRSLTIAAFGIAIAAACSFTLSRAEAMPLGVPAGAADPLNVVESVALCFYIDGWNGPGMYECGFRHRRGMGWHGARHGGGGRGHMERHNGGGHSMHSGGSGGKKHH